MNHKSYIEVKARDNRELGFVLGGMFKKDAGDFVNKCAVNSLWGTHVDRAGELLIATKRYFPEYAAEMEEYAKSAGIPLPELWTASLEDDPGLTPASEHCTTAIVNGGKLIAHNEDFYPGSVGRFYLLKKILPDITVFEGYYAPTLGGNSFSINSHGFTQTMNTLAHKDVGSGVPRNVLARFFSETKDPALDYEKVKNIPRSSGYAHNLVGRDGKIFAIEMSAKESRAAFMDAPFVHTNHFIMPPMKTLEANTDENGTFTRNAKVAGMLKSAMNRGELSAVMENADDGPKKGVTNEGTIGRFIIDLESSTLYAWLLREPEAGVIEYQI